MKTRWLILLPLLLLACGGPAEEEAAEPNVASAAPAAAAPGSGPERVESERIGTARLRATIAASGTVEAKRITEIGSEVPGRIVAVLVDVGDPVAEGAPLFRIDPGPYRMALTEAEAGLALARAESANAAAEAERLRTLLAQNAASQARYDQQRTRAEVARAQVAQMEARVAKARRDLAQTEVRAPYAASVVERRAHEGAMAGQGPILVLQESGALEAILNVPEATPVAVRAGDPLRLFVEGLPDPIEAAVTSVSQRVDPATRTYEVRADVLDASGQLKAGSYARAELSVSRAEARPVVHRSAVLTRDGRTFVLKIEDGVVHYAPVRVGVAEGDRVELLGGVAPGDVVVRGEATERLADGTHVEPSSDGAQARSEQTEPSS
jgi:RND family efflux transporter MFP subunit